MKKKYFAAFLFLYTIFFFSCAGQNNRLYIPIPDKDYHYDHEKNIDINTITETMQANLPRWLEAYLAGGIEEIEKISSFSGKYAFIAKSEGVNFDAMSRWADYYTPEQDFYLLAGSRIERKMISAAVLYPDNEYGPFYETLIRKAYSSYYPGAEKEDTYWIKTELNNEDDRDYYVFFVLITIDKTVMQDIINNMIRETQQSVTANSYQRNAVNRLRQTFFEGF